MAHRLNTSTVRAFHRSFITGPRFTPVVTKLPSLVPFVAPEEIERSRGRPFAVRLGANELTYGASPKAVEAMQCAANECWMYGDPKAYHLRAAIAEHHNIQPLNVVVGEGVDALLAARLPHLRAQVIQGSQGDPGITG